MDEIVVEEYGSFAHIEDLTGQLVELWEPRDERYAKIIGPTTRRRESVFDALAFVRDDILVLDIPATRQYVRSVTAADHHPISAIPCGECHTLCTLALLDVQQPQSILPDCGLRSLYGSGVSGTAAQLIERQLTPFDEAGKRIYTLRGNPAVHHALG